MRLVQKYGGTSVATPERINAVADRVMRTRRQHDGVVVVVSAMGHTTDELVALALKLNPDPPAREMDMLMSAGETITAPLLTMALVARGVPALALTGPQAGIRTSAAHRKARITDIVPERIQTALDAGNVVVVAGFQGATDGLDITTLGRGGSDTTAVALAAAIGAEACEIYTDVAGVYTADPRIAPAARLLDSISYEEMLELAARGAGVMHPRAVEIGEVYNVPIWVRSSFEESPGTLITREPNMENRQPVRGIAHDTHVAKVTMVRVPDRPGIAAALFSALGAENINVDMIVQNVSHEGATDVSFTVAEADLRATVRVVEALVAEIGAERCDSDAAVGTVSVVGTGIRGAPGVFAAAFKALADAGINIQLISTSEIRLTCVVDRDQVPEAVKALHAVFIESLAVPTPSPERRDHNRSHGSA